MKADKEWYLLVQGDYEDKGVFVNFYCKSEGIGGAIDLIEPLANKEGIGNLKFIESTRIDNLEEFEYPEKILYLSDEVKIAQDFHLFDKDSNEYSFTPPIGFATIGKTSKNNYFLIRMF